MMIEVTLDTTQSILYIRPTSALNRGDFTQLANIVDIYIGTTGRLAGLVVELSTFPGWQNLDAMTAHYRFVRDHHRQIGKVAVVTDSAVGGMAERWGPYVVSPEIKRFSMGENEAARQWILNQTSH